VPTDSTRVLIGRCHEGEQILPFGPWIDALRAGRVGGGPRMVRDPAAGYPARAGRSVSRTQASSWSVGGFSRLPTALRGMGLVLGHVADGQPTVLILEDLHWADEMSIRLLAFISRRLQARPLLVLVTAREEELIDAPILHRTLGELERESRVAL